MHFSILILFFTEFPVTYLFVNLEPDHSVPAVSTLFAILSVCKPSSFAVLDSYSNFGEFQQFCECPRF